MKINEISTPVYVLEEEKLEKNLQILSRVAKKSGVKIFCALKGFAFSPVLKRVDEILDGATTSGLIEAKYAKEYFKNGEICTYSPAYKDNEIDEILEISDHIIFNSFFQLEKFRQKWIKSGKKIGLRINPQTSFAPIELYNPCGKFSRLGITKENFIGDLNGVSGFHCHALCEESSENLEIVIKEVEKQFGEFLPKMEWMNFGGGHHITKDGYNVELLIKLLKDFSKKWNLQVFIEPGEAIGWESGFLVTEILDIVENGVKTCIIDASAECHMPDTLAMPYRPKIRTECKNGDFAYRFGGATCLAGDIVAGETDDEIYKFKNELKVGDRIIFEDQIHYTIVKNTTFNGVKLPDFGVMNKNGDIKIVKKFGYEDYKRRN